MSPMCCDSQARPDAATHKVFFRSPPTASIGATVNGRSIGSGA